MNVFIIPVETLRQEHEERVRRVLEERRARQLAGRSTTVNFLFEKFGDVLIAVGNRLQARASKAARPLEHAGSSITR